MTFDSMTRVSKWLKCETYVEYELQYTRWLLKFLGVWPMVADKISIYDRIASLLLIILNVFGIGFILIPCAMHILLKEQNPKVQLILLGPVGFRMSNMLKYISIIYRIDLIKDCFNHVKIDWFTIESDLQRNVMLESVNMARSLTKICAIFMYTGGGLYHTIMPLLKKKRLNAFNVTIKPHVYPGYDFFLNPQATPTYEIIFIAHCLCAFIAYTMTICACNLASTFVRHICGQVQIMKLKLEDLVINRKDDDDDANEIGSIIKCHVRLLRFSTAIEKMLQEICLIEVVASSLIICLLEYYCLTEWQNSEAVSLITYILLLTSFTFNIFIFCHIGEILTHQCQVVGQMTYMIDWHLLPQKTMIQLIPIIIVAKRPKKITAGGMIHLTIQSFGKVIKTSVAYLNLLVAMAE